ncbi:hypothetical protein BABINDRAFT_161869 [Babjeviella inositovora NRRL Y-12698]|uniref:Amino acid transporter transmembrane domain-containing protein n=1 Tax=Babjeviella inositovora NRRL Y-12698 TaxID=984486 RepID=A0A1E3QP54_9ASCO|nr:uncharacterized protein BABINDRAFT_161869 [Babjeviella inositovora NRRL Y-12698]ODQ79473.1 hypothetical protein BABINDRAFT_161869 [Babjeviella inositovora NRRL Y-12698]
MSAPTNIGNRERRRSVLDVGGPNSINQFASSFKRAQTYMTIDVDNEAFDLSPRSSVVDDALLATPAPQYDSVLTGRVSPAPLRGIDSIQSFHFPGAPTDVERDGFVHRRASMASVKSTFREITGDSTAPQTIFNSINVMVGIGILSLPLGLKYCGWVYGVILLTLSALTTRYTAVLIGRILAKHDGIYSYGELAKFCYGTKGQYVVSLIFCFDLVGACVSLILLFADSLTILVPSVSSTSFKIIVCAISFVVSFLPFSILSFLSVIGIICTSSIVVLVTVCGLFFGGISAPGSLLAPEVTNTWPLDYTNILLGLGIFMAPWGGHAVFPELFRDMRHPHKYTHCVNVTFLFSYGVDIWLAVVGFLMFGVNVAEEITQNLMLTTKYPAWVPTVIAVLMGLLPLSKAPLMTKPILTAAEQVLGIDKQILALKNQAELKRALFKVFIQQLLLKVLIFAMFYTISITVTSFGKMMAFLGSAICFTICITLPLMFYRHIFYAELSQIERLGLAAGITLSTVCCVFGSYAAICF